MGQFSETEFNALSQDIFNDFNECIQDNFEDIQDCINELNIEVFDSLFHQLFRSMHSFKGNCTMVNLRRPAKLLHALENIVSDWREDKYEYHENFGALIISAITEVEIVIQQLRREGEASDHLFELIEGPVENLRVLSDDQLRIQAAQEIVQLIEDQEYDSAVEIPALQQSSRDDLEFFRELGHRIDSLSIYWKDRITVMTDIVIAMNEKLGSPVDNQQLEAAICLHDLGMALIPHTIFNKQGELSREEQKMVERHVDVGAQLLSRIEGWEEAALCVEQHHERYDGTGYPKKLSGDEITPGAMIVSIADTFFSITNERPDRSYKKSLFSAITEINSNSGMQFHEDYVEVFNEVVREQFINSGK